MSEANSICSVDGCERPRHANGMCAAHDLRSKRGIPLDKPIRERIRRYSKNAKCAHCSRPVQSKGLCEKHYRALWKHGDPTADKTHRQEHQICQADGCENKSHAKGYCYEHYGMVRRSGAPIRQRTQRKPIKRTIIGGKLACITCGKPKLPSKFYLKPGGRLDGECKPCRKARSVKGARKRRAILRNVFDEAVELHDIAERDGWRCQLCGKKVKKRKASFKRRATLDHIVPLSKGGRHRASNLQLAHFDCNSRKSDKMGAQQRLW